MLKKSVLAVLDERRSSLLKALRWTCCAFLLVLSACGDRNDTIVSLAIHPTKPHILYVATNEAVYKTRDTGASWKRLENVLKRTSVINLVIDPQLPANVYAGTLSDGVYKSPDGGRQWFARNAGLQKGTISVNVQQLVFFPRNSQALYAATTVGVFRSIDGGNSWIERMQGMTEINFIVALAIDPQHPNIVYAGTSGGVYRSVDATESWVKRNSGLVPDDAKMASMALGVNVMVVDPETTQTVYAGTTQGLFQSTDGADSWNRIGGPLRDSYISTLALAPRSPNVVYVGTSQGLLKSLDAGESWMPANQGLAHHSIRVIRIDPTDAQVLYCGTNGGGLYRSTNAGESWVRIPLKKES